MNWIKQIKDLSPLEKHRLGLALFMGALSLAGVILIALVCFIIVGADYG